MTIKLNKTGAGRALHAQLMNYYRDRILDGSLPPGTRIPTDSELVAEHRISRDTVRQALAPLVSEGLIERVQGRGTFVRNVPVKQNLAIRQKHIGLVFNRPQPSQLDMDVLIGVEQAAKSHGYSVSFTYAEGDPEQQARDIARLRANNAIGLIILPAGDTVHDAAIKELQSSHFPIVLIDRYDPELVTDYVGLDNVNGGYRVTEHLLILGHRRIGFVFFPAETLRTTSVHERWRGYCKALEEYGIPYDETLVVPNFSMLRDNTQQGYAQFFGRPDRPSAIFAVNDYIALDVLRAAELHHLHVPEDLAVVGFDDLEFAAHLNPPLTTVAQPFVDIGLRAGNLLISRIEGQTGAHKHFELLPNLIIRESCGAHLQVKRLLALQQE